MSVSRTLCKMWTTGISWTIFKTECVRYVSILSPQLHESSLTGNLNVNKEHKTKIHNQSPKQRSRTRKKDKQHQVYCPSHSEFMWINIKARQCFHPHDRGSCSGRLVSQTATRDGGHSWAPASLHPSHYNKAHTLPPCLLGADARKGQFIVCWATIRKHSGTHLRALN